MGELVTVTCPQCGFSKAVSRSAIPAGAKSATCPQCRKVFTLPLVDRPPDLTEGGAAIDGGGESLAPSTDGQGISGSQGTDPSPGPATPGPRAARPQTLTFSFMGNGREYFGIWIVNTLLKIVTLGFYSAWAKVRMRRYFYGSATLAGEPFDYLANPLALFKGWIIGATAFLLYMIASRLSPVMSMIVGLVIFIAVPWLVVRSRMFNARNSAHRNIRFSFRPNYEGAYLVFMGLPLLAPFTLGFIMPYAIYRQKRFLVENSSYGTTPFTFHAMAKDYYFLFLRVTLGALGLLALFFAIFYLAAGGSAGIWGAMTAKPPAGAKHLALLPMLFFFLFYFYLATYVQTALANLTWSGTAVGDCRFKSSLRVRDMVWLYLSNAAAIACTLGLFIPWAMVRMARYRFQRLEVAAHEGVDGFIATARSEEVGATGEEIGDIFGVNVDFGF
ncbi:MAG TPA: DUF898 family protein [Geobacteraceae bacterium]